MRVQAASELGISLTQLGHDVGKKCLLIVGDGKVVVHVTYMQYATVLLQPAVYIGHVKAHRVLPHKPAYAASYAWRFVEQALLGLDRLTLLVGAPYLTVLCRVAEDTTLYQVS